MSGNGVDLAAVYGLLRSVADTAAGLVTQVGELRQEVDAMRQDVDAMRRDMARKEDVEQLRAEVAGLRETVTDYHAAVVGHGSFISELDGRTNRVEQHLGLPPA